MESSEGERVKSNEVFTVVLKETSSRENILVTISSGELSVKKVHPFDLRDKNPEMRPAERLLLKFRSSEFINTVFKVHSFPAEYSSMY